MSLFGYQQDSWCVLTRYIIIIYVYAAGNIHVDSFKRFLFYSLSSAIFFSCRFNFSPAIHKFSLRGTRAVGVKDLSILAVPLTACLRKTNSAPVDATGLQSFIWFQQHLSQPGSSAFVAETIGFSRLPTTSLVTFPSRYNIC